MRVEDQHVFEYLYRIGDYVGWQRAKHEIPNCSGQSLAQILHICLGKDMAVSRNQEDILLSEIQHHADTCAIARLLPYLSTEKVLRTYLEQIWPWRKNRSSHHSQHSVSKSRPIHSQKQLACLIRADRPRALLLVWDTYPERGFSYSDYGQTVQMCAKAGSIRILECIHDYVLANQPSKQHQLIDAVFGHDPPKTEQMLRWLLDRSIADHYHNCFAEMIRFHYPTILLEYLQKHRPTLTIQSWINAICARGTSLDLATFLRDELSPDRTITCALYGAELYWEPFLISYQSIQRYLPEGYTTQLIKSRYISYQNDVFLDKAIAKI